MRNRWLWFSICLALSVITFICGWLIPAHLRAVDSSLIERAGKNSISLIDSGLALVNEQKPGPALLLLKAAQSESIPGREKLGAAITNSTSLRRAPAAAHDLDSNPEPFTEYGIRLENRERILELLRASPRAYSRELLRCRDLTNTVLFPPSHSASGQAFDAALAICGLLVDGNRLNPALTEAIMKLATESNRGGNTERFEQVLMDLMSLGQRLNWGQLVEFMARIQTTETLRLLANVIRNSEDRLPALFSAVNLSGNPASIAEYLRNFSESGLKDLSVSLRFGSGGINELLKRNQRISVSNARQSIAKYDPFGAFFYWAADYCWREPWVALIIKWILFLAAGYFIATALHFARPAVSALERPLQVSGFHVAREVLFALGFLLVVLLLSEPFLSQESQRVELPFRVRLPMVGSAVPAGSPGPKPSLMNQYALLTLFLFFVLQALLYTACLFKLAEIRRQRVAARIKLRLLENEDHLFDAGLYLGFAGTIISLILVSLNFIKPSLMAAYSSTSFGIIFVSIFKIFHLRPARRQLLLESEAPAAAHRLAAPL